MQPSLLPCRPDFQHAYSVGRDASIPEPHCHRYVVIKCLFFIRNLTQGLGLKVPYYFWTSFYQFQVQKFLYSSLNFYCAYSAIKVGQTHALPLAKYCACGT